MLDSKIVDETLSFDEARAMAAHLSKNYTHLVELISDHQLNKLLSETPVSTLPTADKKAGQLLPDALIYEKGKCTDVCTLIMSGKVTVVAGDDNFRSDVSSWSLLGVGALEDSSYAPDFSAYVSNGPCRCLRLSRSRFSAAVDASALERHAQQPHLQQQQQQQHQQETRSTFSSAFLHDTFGRHGRPLPSPLVGGRIVSSSPPPSPKPHAHRHSGILAALEKAEGVAAERKEPTTESGKARTVTFLSERASPSPSGSPSNEGGADKSKQSYSADATTVNEHHNPVAAKILLTSSFDDIEKDDNDA
jgi:hypothetical protein